MRLFYRHDPKSNMEKPYFARHLRNGERELFNLDTVGRLHTASAENVQCGDIFEGRAAIWDRDRLAYISGGFRVVILEETISRISRAFYERFRPFYLDGWELFFLLFSDKPLLRTDDPAELVEPADVLLPQGGAIDHGRGEGHTMIPMPTDGYWYIGEKDEQLRAFFHNPYGPKEHGVMYAPPCLQLSE